MARVVITSRLPGRVAEILSGHELLGPRLGGAAGAAAERLTAAQLDEVLPSADALLPLLSLRVDETLLARAPRLRIVANYAVGYDNVDVSACTRRGVLVTHTPGVLTEATADLTLALILGVARRIPEGLALARSGAWRGWEPTQLLGLALGGATLGIVGLGRIGQAVARRAQAFGMRIAYAQPRPARGFVEAALEAEHLPLEVLLGRADVVSLHCPLLPATRHLIGARELGLIRPAALLVNTARGPIVDEAALGEALEQGHLGGVGLDVFEDEPEIPARLRASPRALILPHLGSATSLARAAMAETAAESIRVLLAGRRPAHCVNPEVLTSR